MSKKSMRADLACKALRQAIIEQALPPGTKLPEDELGARFGMVRHHLGAAGAGAGGRDLADPALYRHDPVVDLHQPARALAAGRTLAARFMEPPRGAG